MTKKKIALKIYKREIHQHPALLIHFQSESGNSTDSIIEDIDDYYLYKNQPTIKQFITLLKLYGIPYSVKYYE